MEARWLTVGPVQENTWIARQPGSDAAILIDPGDEPEKIIGALEDPAGGRVKSENFVEIDVVAGAPGR